MSYQPAPHGQQPTQQPPNWPAPPPPSGWSTWSGRKRGIIAAAAIVLGVAAFLGLQAYNQNTGPSLTSAEQTCNKGRSGGDLADGGKTLLIDLRGTSPAEQIRGAMDADTFTCVLDSLEVPSSVRAHIQGTRALDGRQSDSWDGFEASWTYHPDHGLQMTIEAK